MLANLRILLVIIDADYAAEYEENARLSDAALRSCQGSIQDIWDEYSSQPGERPRLITFHDGFQYFARAFDLELLASIEEEAGSEASAHEIVEITELVREYRIPAIFTEVSGSDATAKAIGRETGCGVYQLDMVMSGEGTGVEDYERAIVQNLRTVAEVLK